MKIIEQIRSMAGNRAIQKCVSNNQREKSTCNLESAGSIGILFQVDSEKDYNLIHSYAKELKAQKKDVKALGFLIEPALEKFLMPVITFDFITSKELNWFGKPKSEKFDEFVQRKFDICLDFTPAGCMAMKFAVASSNASFKVGRYDQGHLMLYDLMLEIKNDSDLEVIVKEVDHYLKIIKPA